jgi:hypothetical protein
MKSPKLLTILSILFLIIALILGLQLVAQRQLINKKAAVSNGTLFMSLSGPANTPLGQNLPIQVNISTGSTPSNSGIVSAAAYLTYSSTSAVGLPTIAETLTAPWSYSFKNVSTSGSTTTIEIIAIYNSPGLTGYVPTGTFTLATLNFPALNAGSVTLNFDMTQSFVYSKDGAIDILNSSATGNTFTVSTAPSSTPTSTPTTAPIATSTPTPIVATPTITPVPPISCSTGQLYSLNPCDGGRTYNLNFVDTIPNWTITKASIQGSDTDGGSSGLIRSRVGTACNLLYPNYARDDFSIGQSNTPIYSSDPASFASQIQYSLTAGNERFIDFNAYPNTTLGPDNRLYMCVVGSGIATPTPTPVIIPISTPTPGIGWYYTDPSGTNILCYNYGLPGYTTYYTSTNCTISATYPPIYGPAGVSNGCSTNGTGSCYYFTTGGSSPVAQSRYDNSGTCVAGPIAIGDGTSTLKTCHFGLQTTPTSIPSPTPVPPTQVNLSVHLQGVTNPAANQLTNQFHVRILQNAAPIIDGNYQFNYLGSDVYKLNSPLNLGANSGLFDILIKGPSHLQRKWSNIPLYSGVNAPPLDPQTPLIAGDIVSQNLTQIPDNILSPEDLAAMNSLRTQPNVAVTTSNQLYDLNFDGTINADDLALILANRTAPTIYGDN